MTTTLLGAHLFNFLHDRVLWEGCEVLSNELRWVEYRLPAAASLIVPYEQIVLIRQQGKTFLPRPGIRAQINQDRDSHGFYKKISSDFRSWNIFQSRSLPFKKRSATHDTAQELRTSVSDPHLLLCGSGSWSLLFSIWIQIQVPVFSTSILNKYKY